MQLRNAAIAKAVNSGSIADMKHIIMIIYMHLPSYSALSSHPTPLLLGMYGSNLLALMSWS